MHVSHQILSPITDPRPKFPQPHNLISPIGFTRITTASSVFNLIGSHHRLQLQRLLCKKPVSTHVSPSLTMVMPMGSIPSLEASSWCRPLLHCASWISLSENSAPIWSVMQRQCLLILFSLLGASCCERSSGDAFGRLGIDLGPGSGYLVDVSKSCLGSWSKLTMYSFYATWIVRQQMIIF